MFRDTPCDEDEKLYSYPGWCNSELPIVCVLQILDYILTLRDSKACPGFIDCIGLAPLRPREKDVHFTRATTPNRAILASFWIRF